MRFSVRYRIQYVSNMKLDAVKRCRSKDLSYINVSLYLTETVTEKKDLWSGYHSSQGIVCEEEAVKRDLFICSGKFYI